MTTTPGWLPGSSAMIERVSTVSVVALLTRRAVPPLAAAAARASPTGRVAPTAGMSMPVGSRSVGRRTAPGSAAG